MRKLEVTSFHIKRTVAAVIGGVLLGTSPLPAAAISILNPGLEDPEMPNVFNTSFSGVHGIGTGVPGWSSNEPDSGGSIRVDYWYLGRTGNNVLYLHGTENQNFYTANFDLGVALQSYTTYTLTFDVIRWVGVTENDYVQFRAGIYTGASYEERSSLAEISGLFYLLDDQNNAVDAKTVTLNFTTGEVPLDTKFWIGGDALGNSADGHRAHFDNFSLVAQVIPEPSSVELGLAGIIAFGWTFSRTSKRRRLDA